MGSLKQKGTFQQIAFLNQKCSFKQIGFLKQKGSFKQRDSFRTNSGTLSHGPDKNRFKINTDDLLMNDWSQNFVITGEKRSTCCEWVVTSFDENKKEDSTSLDQ